MNYDGKYFIKRLGALVFDIVLLKLFTYGLGYVFKDLLVDLPHIGKVIGFVILICYFTVFNSQIGNGQTIGKKIMNISVVGMGNKYISIQKSFTRALISTWFITLGYAVIYIHSTLIQMILGVLYMSFFIGTVYFYMTHEYSRQVIHDLICNTYVQNGTRNAKINSKKDLLAALIIIGVSMVINIGFMSVVGFNTYNQMNSISKILLEDPQVQLIKNSSYDEDEGLLTYEVVVRSDVSSYEKKSIQLAKVILNEKTPELEMKGVNITVTSEISLILGTVTLKKKKYMYLEEDIMFH